MSKKIAARSSRRAFLEALGVGAAAGALAHWVPVLEAEAQSAIPKRLVILLHPNGNNRENWLPGPGEVLGRSMAPLARHESRILTCTGGITNALFPLEDAGVNDHGRCGAQILTGRPCNAEHNGMGISIDNHVAAGIAADRPQPSIVLGAGEAGRYSFTSSAAPVAALRDPGDGLARLFPGGMVGGGDGASSARDLARRRIYESVREQLAGVRSRVGTEDRRRIDAHVASVDEARRRIEAASRVVCETPTITEPTTAWSSDNGYRYAPDLHAHVLAAAFGCDITRVAVIALGTTGNSGHSVPWLGFTRDVHDIAHTGSPPRREAEAVSFQTQLDEWHAERLATLLDELAAVPERDGSSVLDHTLVVWGSAMSRGNHSHIDLPWVLAGGLIRGGRTVRVTGRTTNDLWVSVANIMGLRDTTFGEARHCTGPISEISS